MSKKTTVTRKLFHHTFIHALLLDFAEITIIFLRNKFARIMEIYDVKKGLLRKDWVARFYNVSKNNLE
jgi:hypothetical protein